MQAMDPPGVVVVVVVEVVLLPLHVAYAACRRAARLGRGGGGSGGGAPRQLLGVQLLGDPAVLGFAHHVHEALLAPPPSAAGLAVAASCSHLG